MEVWSFDLDGSVVMIEALWLTASRGIVPAEDERLTELRGVIDSLVLTSSESIEPTPTTLALDAETMSDFEILQAGVTAFYSGDADRRR
jgi:hypothetical protein